MCQGNGASPAAWAVTTIPMIRAHRKKGHGAFFISPISKLKCQLIGGLFVDDTDIIHVDMRTWEDLPSAHYSLQVSVDNWGQLLIATGGALKPIKCSYYLISFRWKKDGTWTYQDNTDDDELRIFVPMADGSKAQIEQLPVTKAIKTLGSMTCPTGCSKAALEQMQQQGQEWVDRVISGKNNRRNMWKMLDCQFWPRLGYAIGNTTASLAEFDKCLQRIYWQIVPRGGVRGSAPKHLRTLNKGFYGIRCPHPGIECMIAQRPSRKATNTLRLPIRNWYPISSLDGTIHYRARAFRTTPTRIVRKIWQARHPLLDQINLGKSFEIQGPGRVGSLKYRSTKGERPMVHESGRGIRHY